APNAGAALAAGAEARAAGRGGFVFPAEYAGFARAFEDSDDGGAADLFFQLCEGVNASRAMVSGRELVNFCSYNYLGLSGHDEVSRAASAAIERYGTSVSASRLVSGERPIHRQLEGRLAALVGAEDAVVFVGGFSTNENAIGHLLGPEDLIVYDSLIHASIQQGAKLSGATVLPFPHNNLAALENILARRRGAYRQALIAVEGVYSMDGDIPDLPRLVEIKRRHNALVLVDEAHSIGVLGGTGRGIGEYHGVAGSDVDLWMGTLSKALASCGGYIAGTREVVAYLKRTAPGFVYSVGLSPPDTAAALAALGVLEAEPQRVACLKARARLFLDLAKARGLDTGASRDSAVIPIMTGATDRAVRLSKALLGQGFLALPIGYPAVPENKARLRFFISSTHSEDDIRRTINAIGDCLEQIDQ
ncbi:MAG TPA: aminotransferase class I/II-fold pyridoxal phosphate-dependent enzyme, partial [Hyphomicrobiales bacterium]|nr:aminotransferase class I/II-fold pyridoxal phosphate-dependent enzyme [Hyphomicrobiales bacterium]